jgi:epoxyqueuosine reductase QueG
MRIQDELKEFLLEKGVSDVGFFSADDGDLPFGISIAVRLSESIMNEIEDEPTHTYFNHYRSVNAFIDSMLLQAGLFLQRKGYKYITVAASQSINKDGWNYKGRYSHKKAACLAGMGSIGKNSLFLHNEYGSYVRLGTLFTDCPFESENREVKNLCNGCDLCVKACPAKAIKGGEWTPGTQREEIFDPKACSDYMKNKFQKIGRGSVCGICMRVCPKNK